MEIQLNKKYHHNILSYIVIVDNVENDYVFFHRLNGSLSFVGIDYFKNNFYILTCADF